MLRPSWTIDGPARATGRLQFVEDIEPAGTLQTAIVRSQEAHARIVRVDTTRASAVPGVTLAIGGVELARSFGRPITFGPVYRDQPALAIDKVRYVGEPVAAVVAADPDRAAEAAALVEVEYEPIPSVVDLDMALADGAALVHEAEREAGSYGFAAGPAGTNVCSSFRLRKGSVELGFAEADEIVEDLFETPSVQHVPLEHTRAWCSCGPAVSRPGPGPRRPTACGPSSRNCSASRQAASG